MDAPMIPAPTITMRSESTHTIGNTPGACTEFLRDCHVVLTRMYVVQGRREFRMIFTWICVLASTLAINTIFVITLLAALTWEQRAVSLFAATVLAGGLFFTIRTMQGLKAR